MRSLVALLCASSVFAADTVSLKREGAFWVETTSGSIEAKAPGFRVSTIGGVVVRGGADGRVVYVVRKRVRARSEAEAQRVLRQVRVAARTLRDTGSLTVLQPPAHPGWIDVEVQLPRSLRTATVLTRGGNVAATDLAGSVHIESAGGTIELDRIGGNAFAKTGGGEIRAGAIAGQLRCISAGGSIRAARVGGETWVETAGGEIAIGESNGAVRASTMGGNIRVERSGSFVTAQTAGGRIEVLQARGLVNAENSGGSIEVGAAQGVRLESSRGGIRLRGSSGSLRAATDVGNILAELVSGSTLTDSELSTGSGDVTVFIPSNFPVTVKAQSERGRSARIVSEFPGFGAQRAVLPAVTEGCVNGCGPVLRISASGTIYLRRR